MLGAALLLAVQALGLATSFARTSLARSILHGHVETIEIVNARVVRFRLNEACPTS
jgi:hypothetical protein